MLYFNLINHHRSLSHQRQKLQWAIDDKHYACTLMINTLSQWAIDDKHYACTLMINTLSQWAIDDKHYTCTLMINTLSQWAIDDKHSPCTWLQIISSIYRLVLYNMLYLHWTILLLKLTSFCIILSSNYQYVPMWRSLQ